MATTKPTVLFVHGSWHTPKHFVRIRDLFEKSGFPTSCPLQPSSSHSPPEIGLEEDAACIREELKQLIDREGKHVIIIGHSYGGVVATQAVDEEFALEKRKADGKSGGVLQLVYMCAFLLPLNVSLAGQFGGSLPPFITVDKDGMCMMQDPETRFYHDLPEAEQRHWSNELIWCPVKGQETPITYLAYLHHPITYVFCEEDKALPLEVQKMMVEKVEIEGGINVRRVNCGASHSPFLSQPESILKAIE